jgi:uncharacterized repeat protein (TIGR03803 family)
MKNTHRNNTNSRLAALAARGFATIALIIGASLGALPLLASAQTPTLTVIADLADLPNQDIGTATANFGVIQATDGNFYGTTTFGGSANFGQIFRVSPTGTITTLVNFTGPNGTYPIGGLIQASDGNLYGTTSGGGGDANGNPFPTQYGTVYRVTLSGTLTTIFTFSFDAIANRWPNGHAPQAALVQGSDGNLYGTTLDGGTDSSETNNDDGTIFKMSTSGTLLMVVTVHGGAEPQMLRAPLIQGKDGNLYGVSYKGGDLSFSGGTVFKCTPSGVVTVLHGFTDPEGDKPEGGVVQASDGNLYGTTEGGGTANLGAVYRVTLAGEFTVLHQFTGSQPTGPTDGAQPFGEMIQASDGNFYGTTSGGGTGNLGSIFQLTPAGVYTTVYSFPNTGMIGAGITGQQPRGTLLQTSDGNFVGTTTGGGVGGAGTVFRLNVVPQAALLNVSTRLNVGTGNNVLIGGFIVTGTLPKQVILRAIGPSLAGFGVRGALADPVLELHDPDGTVITNNNWKDTQESEVAATNLAPSNDLESAIVASLAPGAYTAIVTGNNNTTGVALIEAYDLDQTVDSQLANISTRGFVDTGDNVLIGGFIVGGPDGVESTAIVRALGPSLSGAVGPSVLADPNLELHDSDGAVIASNDDWKNGPDMQTIIDDGLAPTDTKESALLANLPPGAYTAIVSGVGNGAGIGLVEVYNLQ